MVKGVLFDMDGLMFDTERLSLEAWRFAGRQLGFAPRDEFLLALRGSMGDEARAKLQREFGPGFDYDRTRQVRLAYADSWIEQHGMPVKPGLLPLLEELKARGIPAALATSTTRPTAWGYLTRAGVKDYFAASVCGGEVERPKPCLLYTSTDRRACLNLSAALPFPRRPPGPFCRVTHENRASIVPNLEFSCL